jgi:hypothetical protein
LFSTSFGWECNNLNNNGANMGMHVNRDIILQGIQVDCSIVSLNDTPGMAMVLFDCVTYPAFPIQGPPPQVYLGVTPNADFSFSSQSSFNDATGGSAHGGAGGSGRLFAAIAKIWSPSSASRLIVIPALNYSIPGGSDILFHMDHFGVPCDGEMQGVFFYT